METHNLFFEEILKISGVIVSVGCGMGVLENKLRKKGKIVICIDPNDRDEVDQYTGVKRELMPDYSSVTEFLKVKPHSIGKVNVLLGHPLPDYNLCDIMAIKRLEPKYIFIDFMKCGGAGTWLLHRFLRKNGVKTKAKLETEKSLAPYKIEPTTCLVKYKYNKVFEMDCGKKTYLIMNRGEFIDSIIPNFFYEDKEEVLTYGDKMLSIKQFERNLLILLSANKV